MRIALIVPGGVDRSGEYRVIPALLTMMRRLSRHNELHVIALSQEFEPGEWELAGAHVHNIGSRHMRSRALRCLLSLHRQTPLDVVQSIWSGTCGLVAVMAGKLLGIPSFIHIAGGELVALHDIGYGGRLKWRGRLRERIILHSASAITAASAPIIDSLSELGFAGRRLPLGVDLDSWPPREPVRRVPGKPAKLLHIASLNRVKDQPTLLQALVILKSAGTRFELDVVGDDTLRGEIQTLAAHLGLADGIRFRGFLTQHRLRPVVEAADVLLISSRHEAGPLATLEAAVAGVPTVGTAVGHIAEWAPHAALAVPVGDPAALAAAIGKVLGDEDLRVRVAGEALRRATAEDADYTARRFEELYKSVV